MGETSEPTEFLPAARADAETIRRQRSAVLAVPKLAEILDAVGDAVVFLNAERQIVHANKAAVDFIRGHGGDPVPGARWGEALRCERAAAGCGTSRFCRACGAARAVWSARFDPGETADCLLTQTGGDALDFRVKAEKISLGHEEFTVFTAVDVGDARRLEALQKTFFHDVMNTVFGVRGLLELLPGASPEDLTESMAALKGLADDLVEEVAAQRDLLAAENRELPVHPVPLDSLSVLLSVVAAYREHPAAKGRTLLLDGASSAVEFVSDRTLLRRVLGNMIKNALEASAPGESVRVGCAADDGRAAFWVQNSSVIPPDAQLQIFQRSFSTRGEGRGLGTYSMRLLTERYLRGTVDFVSAKGRGTRFTARYPLVLRAVS